jgi:hypothetical protein
MRRVYPQGLEGHPVMGIELDDDKNNNDDDDDCKDKDGGDGCRAARLMHRKLNRLQKEVLSLLDGMMKMRMTVNSTNVEDNTAPLDNATSTFVDAFDKMLKKAMPDMQLSLIFALKLDKMKRWYEFKPGFATSRLDRCPYRRVVPYFYDTFLGP